jgi:L-asparaginase II
VEHSGPQVFGLTPRELALVCASHSGTDEHLTVVRAIQAKTGVKESDLMCGTHPITEQATAEGMRSRGEQPTPNRHNCSGKHTGMLAYTLMKHLPLEPETLPYINPQHPIQQEILQAFAEMCGLPVEQVSLGIDGCSAPNFGVPLYNAALAYARLCDPYDLPAQRAEACRSITSAMTTNPFMVGGPDSFDTHLMETVGGRILCKGGAEGYQALGILAGALAPESPGIGITFKISDGDGRGRVRPAVSLEVLRQLGALSPEEIHKLEKYGPELPIYNWRKLEVGEARPVLPLKIQKQWSSSK